MRTATSLALLALSTLSSSVYALPATSTSNSDSNLAGGKLIVPPPKPTDTGLKQIPDEDHPFKAPGVNDLRGPCPGLNTLANHGYLPRNGIVSFEQIVKATGEGFNMEYTLASALAAFGMLARGNAFIDQISIGLPTSLVPPLPGNLDGPQALGLATHGRFEGDVSMTRADAAIGDNRNFNQTLFNELLALVAQFGDDSPVTGPKSIVNLKAMQEFKFNRFTEDQQQNTVLEYHIGRLLLSYGESAFTLNFFANGTDGTLSVPTMTSFFAKQRFPNNWHRRSSPAGFDVIGASALEVESAHPVAPGANNAQGQYVADNLTVSPICGLYNNLGSENLSASLNNATGLLQQNVNTLLDAIYAPFASSCPKVLPAGPCCV